MDLADDGGSRFSAYVDGLASVIGHKDREGPLRDYCLGLMMPCERKSVEPLAAVIPQNIAFADLIDFAKLRWRIERDYQELKQEVGLGHFEGRGWRGFHHHATLCIAAYGFLISERAMIAPSKHRSARMFQRPAVPDDYRPRGSAAATRTPCPELNRHHAPPPRRRPRQNAAAMPMLRSADRQTITTEKFVMQ